MRMIEILSLIVELYSYTPPQSDYSHRFFEIISEESRVYFPKSNKELLLTSQGINVVLYSNIKICQITEEYTISYNNNHTTNFHDTPKEELMIFTKDLLIESELLDYLRAMRESW